MAKSLIDNVGEQGTLGVLRAMSMFNDSKTYIEFKASLWQVFSDQTPKTIYYEKSSYILTKETVGPLYKKHRGSFYRKGRSTNQDQQYNHRGSGQGSQEPKYSDWGATTAGNTKGPMMPQRSSSWWGHTTQAWRTRRRARLLNNNTKTQDTQTRQATDITERHKYGERRTYVS